MRKIANVLREWNWLAFGSVLALLLAASVAVLAVYLVQFTALAIVLGLFGVVLALFAMV